MTTRAGRRRTAISVVAGGLLAVAGLNPALAQPAPIPDSISGIADVAIAPAGEGLVTSRKDSPVAPGVNYTAFERLDARGWLRGDFLVADLDKHGVTVDYVNAGKVSAGQPLSQQLARKGAIAGVNGDFFDINDTTAPLGVGIERSGSGGRLINAPAAGHNDTAVIGKDGLGRIAQIFLQGTATDDDATKLDLTNLNSPAVSADGIGLYTPEWGDAARTRTVDGLPTVREVILRDGVVVSSTTTPGTTPLAPNELALIGREGGATALTAFEAGDKVDVRYGPRADAADVAAGVSGNLQLARAGKVLADVPDADLAPRTAVGFTDNGRRMVLLTVDGRATGSRGLSLKEMGQLMVGLGADDVLNLDGGGSSTMLARTPGAQAPAVVNSPSDGAERLVPNGLGILPTKGSGRLKGFRIEAAGTAAELPDTDISKSSRVLTGLSRVLTARGHDETYAPAPGTPYWSSGTNARVASDGIVTGRRAGDVVVTAARGQAFGRFGMTVLGEAVRLTPSTRQVSLPDATSRGFFTVNGYDADGFSTWVEPRDVQLTYDPALIKLVARGNGFDVNAVGTDAVSTVVTAKVGDLTTQLSVTAGLSSQVVDEVDDVTRWQANAVPVGAATASRSVAAGHDGGQAIALDYSLTGTTATRAAYLSQTPQQTLPGQPQKLGAWVYGDGKGAWLRANAYDGAGGSAQTLNLAAAVDWTGWKYVEATIPPGLTMPLRFWRIYVVETVPT
ncbi:MAG TPA: phosphodiester glycosidase family protein, partial [Kribbella sp.]